MAAIRDAHAVASLPQKRAGFAIGAPADGPAGGGYSTLLRAGTERVSYREHAAALRRIRETAGTSN
jgi:hypothetical protein